jgi:hypothetical protein
MATITVNTTLRSDYSVENEKVGVSGKDEREIEFSKEINDVETFYHLLECSKNQAVRYIWDDIKDEAEWQEWGYYSPYASGDIELTSSRTDVSWLDVAEHKAMVEDITVESAFMELRSNGRTPEAGNLDTIFREFLGYIAEEKDVDTSDWAHGYSEYRVF